ncbi:MAG TPA: AAA family ATPase, partial [Roseiflexaceae bacterium]|nr:AAA family ATPase [Roseiflexaceae bacterium]
VGGIQAVTLGDEEARRRGTQKTVLERKAPPTFDILVEIQSWDQISVYADVASAVDALLRGEAPQPEVRTRDADGQIQRSAGPAVAPASPALQRRQRTPAGAQRIFPVGVRSDRLAEAIERLGVPARVERELSQASLVMTLREYYQRDAPWVRRAEARGVPVYVLRGGSPAHIQRQLAAIFRHGENEPDVPEDADEEGGAGAAAPHAPAAEEIAQLQRRISERYRPR